MAIERVDKGFDLHNQSQLYQALHALDQARELNPQLALAWYNKGAFLGQQHKYDEAISAFDKALSFNPEPAIAAMIWDSIGNLLYSQGKYNESLKAYDKAININPQYDKSWNDKAKALKELGRNDVLANLTNHRAINESNPVMGIDMSNDLSDHTGINEPVNKTEFSMFIANQTKFNQSIYYLTKFNQSINTAHRYFMWVNESNNSSVMNNTVLNNWDGILLGQLNNNVVTRNNISYDKNGIYQQDSDNNTFFAKQPRS